jgi:hypothetical protein
VGDLRVRSANEDYDRAANKRERTAFLLEEILVATRFSETSQSEREVIRQKLFHPANKNTKSLF